MNDIPLLADKTGIIAAGLRSAVAAEGGEVDLTALIANLGEIRRMDNPLPEALIAHVADLATEIDAIVCDSSDMAQILADQMGQATALSKQIEERRKGITRCLDGAKSAIMGWTFPLHEQLNGAVERGKSRLLAYNREQQRIADEARRKAEEEARRAREAAEREAAAKRAQAEREAEELRRQAQAERDSGNVEKAASLEVKAEQRHEHLHARANEAESQAAIQSAAVAVQSAAPAKIKGAATRGKWVASVTDKLAFLRYVANNPQFIALIDINETKLLQQIRATDGALKMDGIAVHRDESVAIRSKVA